MATLVISPVYEYGNFKASNQFTHKSHSLQGRKSPVTPPRRNSTSSQLLKPLSAPHKAEPPLSPFSPKSTTHSSNNNTVECRKLERAMSEPAEKRAAQSNSSRYKTELCRPYEESGTCKYGDKCQFAHGMKELRTLARHPKYKTELCRSFHTTGLCPYGPRCHFIHNSDPGKANMFTTSMSGAPTSRPKALSSSSLGSAGDMSPPSSHNGSPTFMKTSRDFFQFPNTAFPFPPELPSGRQSYLDYTTHEFNPDFYDTPTVFQERLLASVFGSPVTVPDNTDPCSPTLDLYPQGNPVSPSSSTVETPGSGFNPFPVFSLFGKHDLN